MWHSGRKSQRRQSAILLASILSFFRFAAAMARSISGWANLHLLGMRKQVIVDPAGKDRCFHGHHSGLGKGLDPGIKFAPRRSDLAFTLDLAGRVLYAIANRLLVNIKSDVVHNVSRSLLG